MGGGYMRFRTKIAIGFIVFGAIVSIIYGLNTYIFSKSDMLYSSMKSTESKFIERDDLIKSFTHNYEHLLEAISEDKLILEAVKNNNIEKLNIILSTLSKTQSEIYQFRLLSKDGNELIRINKVNHKDIEIVEKNKLQNKAHRYYFNDIKNIKDNEIYKSKIDLNMENNKVQYPFRPTIRFAKKIQLKDEFLGYFLINTDVQNLLNSLSVTTLYNIYLIDKSGNFILNCPNGPENKNYSFGKYLKKDYTIKEHFKNEYQRILSLDEYKSDTFYSKKISLHNKEDIKMILEVKEDVLKVKIDDIINRVFYIMILSFLISLPFIIVLTNLFNKIKLKSEQKLLEETNKNIEKDKLLLKNSKMAMMGEMIAMIAHQWKQPLSSQKAILALLKTKREFGKLTDDILNKNLKQLDDLANHMNLTIEDFRNFFKSDKLKRDVNLKEVVEQSIDLINDSFEINNIKIDLRLQDNCETKTLDRELKQVIINILNNSRDALNSIESNKQININLYDNDEAFFIQISDNAGGIPQDIIDKIFDSYFSTKGEGGTGLGLYMSKIIIEEHLNGTLDVKNNNVGAVFTIQLSK
jgi:signal transduction histidine kinase